MPKRDGKNKFYRTLNLDKNSRDILRWYRKIYQSMVNEEEGRREPPERGEEEPDGS